MKTAFLSHFYKDLDKIKDPVIKKEILQLIYQTEQLPNFRLIGNLKKLKGYKYAYRIKLGIYRVGVFIEKDTIEFARIAHRKDIYKIFP